MATRRRAATRRWPEALLVLVMATVAMIGTGSPRMASAAPPVAVPLCAAPADANTNFHEACLHSTDPTRPSQLGPGTVGAQQQFSISNPSPYALCPDDGHILPPPERCAVHNPGLPGIFDASLLGVYTAGRPTLQPTPTNLYIHVPAHGTFLQDTGCVGQSCEFAFGGTADLAFPLTVLILISSPYLAVTGSPAAYIDDSGNYVNEIAVTLTANGGPPTAAFTVNPNTRSPGQYQFVSDSTDPAGGTVTEKWNFGDGSDGTGRAVTHTYAKPGTFHVTLTATNASGGTNSLTKDVVVKAPTLAASLAFIDSHGTVLPAETISPQIGDTLRVRLTVSASADGVGSVRAIVFTGDPLTAAPSASVHVGPPSPQVPTRLALDAGGSRQFTYAITVKAAGVIRLTSTPKGIDDAGKAVTTIRAQLSTGVSAIKVELRIDPLSYTADNHDGATPTRVTVTETITNISPTKITHVNLRSIDAKRTKPGQLLAITHESGPRPDPTAGYSLADLNPGQSEPPVTSVFGVQSDGRIDFQSLVTAASAAGSTLRGFGTSRLTAKSKYYLGFSAHVVRPAAGLLPAGSPIVIQGRVRNLSDSATLDVGPLYAKVAGNAGLEGLAYNGVGVDPKALVAPGALTLDPGESKTFTLKVLTSYSEPRGDGDVLRSGGTSARVTFTPWAHVTLDDGTEFTTAADGSQTLTTAADLTHRIAIDDAIAIPVTDPVAVVQGVLRGGVDGVWNAASGMVTGLIDLPNISASTLLAVTNYQSLVWDSFTEAQKKEFARSTASVIVPALQANAGLAAEGAAVLFAKASDFTLRYFTNLNNEWHVGNYAETVQTYSSLSTNALAQIAIPVALGRLAKSTEAISAVDAAQAELQARLVAISERVDSAETMQQVATLLTEISDGTELDPAQVRNLFGIAPAELTELQKLASQYRLLLTVRSRAASSIDWLEKFQAMVKPEALKIKSVSALDTRLGYESKYVGSLVFKEPVPLIELRKNGGQISTLVQAYVEQQGFIPGTGDYYNAINRVADRIQEWNKYAKTYKQWSKQGWLDVSFNWDGNKMADPSFGGTGKEAGFRLKPTGVEEEYIVQMYNEKARRLVPVTGDIDPIAFTHLDGTPLTPVEHAELLDAMRTNPLLRTQHGESATYVNGGKDFIESQFKPGEAALQIAPGSETPRIVRFNKAQSIWNSATDYHLIWNGGFDYAGGTPITSGTLNIDYTALAAPEAAAPAGIALALPGDGAAHGANVGRCAMSYSTATSALPLEMSPSGTLVQVVDNQLVESSYQSVCFSDGPVVAVAIRPSTTVSGAIAAGQTEIPVQTGPAAAGDNPATGFAVGQQITIAAGSPTAESGRIARFGSIILSKPLRYARNPGDVIVMTGPIAIHSNDNPATAADPIAATGVPLGSLLLLAGLLSLTGGATTVIGKRELPN